jgi:hypothetical protein
LLMPADPIHPDQLAGEQRFRADLLAYLDSLPVGELAELLGEPSSRREPLQRRAQRSRPNTSDGAHPAGADDDAHAVRELWAAAMNASGGDSISIALVNAQVMRQ